MILLRFIAFKKLIDDETEELKNKILGMGESRKAFSSPDDQYR